MTFKTCLLFAAIALTSGCGISGPLETAPPMWGADRAAYEAELAKKEAERKAAEAAKAAQNPAPAPAPKN
jgi:predicted small lipoprotein YifL